MKAKIVGELRGRRAVDHWRPGVGVVDAEVRGGSYLPIDAEVDGAIDAVATDGAAIDAAPVDAAVDGAVDASIDASVPPPLIVAAMLGLGLLACNTPGGGRTANQVTKLCAHVAQSIADLPAMGPAETMAPDGRVRDYDRRTSAALALSAVAVFCAAPGDRGEVERLIFLLGSPWGNGQPETPQAAADALVRMVTP